MLRSGNRVKLIAAREYGPDANLGCWRLAAWGWELTLRAGRTARSCEASWFQGVRVVEVSAFNDSDPLILGCQLQAASEAPSPQPQLVTPKGQPSAHSPMALMITRLDRWPSHSP